MRRWRDDGDPADGFFATRGVRSKTIVEEAIGQHHATQSFASPAVWDKVGRYCEQEQIQFKDIRRVLSAGAPVRGTSSNG